MRWTGQSAATRQIKSLLGVHPKTTINSLIKTKEIEENFKVKVDDVNTLIRKNKKYVYAKLNPKNPAIDVATKLGMI